MNIRFTLFFLFISIVSFSQNDTIVNYYDYQNKKTKLKPKHVKFTEIITKKNDTLFRYSRYRNNGKIFAYWHSKTIDSKNKVGQFVMFNRYDSISSVTYYNQKGLKSGKETKWFSNRNINAEGYYKNGKKEGAWKFYHFNGKIAAKGFFKNDSLIKAYYFDENGIKKQKPKDCCYKVAEFKGGIKKFIKKIQTVNKKFVNVFKGEIYINYDITVDGNLNNIEIVGNVPPYLKNILINHLKQIEGWQPAEHLGRKIESTKTQRIAFK